MGEPFVRLHQEGAVSAALRPSVGVFFSPTVAAPSLTVPTFFPPPPQIASFVNAKPTDASIQQVSLDILESMVLSSHSLFLQVKQEVTMERLIAHLQV